jgi:hypothetical protein
MGLSWSSHVREEHKLRVIENRVSRGVFEFHRKKKEN